MGTPVRQIENTFNNTENVANQAGHQIIFGGINVQGQPEGDSHLHKLPNAAQAAFNSYDKQHDPLCLPQTRVDVLKQIMAWADGRDERCIFWLNGMAGTGKSTIARTVAREYYNRNCLGASFFFSRGGGDVSHAGKFFTSIAVQLADKSPSLKRYICDAITEHNNIARQALRDQWRQLVLQPLSKLDGNFPHSALLLVVDALDECEGNYDIQEIVRLLAEARSLEAVRLRILLTSRPEIPIRCGFYQIQDSEHQDFVLHDISPLIIDKDISIFLEHSFKNIRQERGLASDWPGEEAIRRLVQNASGLFIWAATACRFIHEGRRYAMTRLSKILKDDSSEDDSSVTAPEKKLNEIYITVLENTVHHDYDDQEKEATYKTLREVLGSIVVLFSPLPADPLAKLLRVPRENVDQTLEDLHAILDIPRQPHRPIRLHHPSFRDFLLSKERYGDPHFWVDEKQVHRDLANNCIRLMSPTLKRDICGLHTPGALTTDVESSQVEKYLPPEVQYACLYWVEHLRKGGAQLCDDDPVHQFLQEHLLHWLEALSLMRKTSEGILAITSLESTVIVKESPGFYAFIHDAKRFTLHNRSAIEKAPLQIYCSALIFTPKMSIVRGQFKDQIPHWICRLPIVQRDWSSLEQTLEGHSSLVYSVAFSPDGNRLASGSVDRTVRVWNAATGQVEQTLEGHSSSVWSVAFSPDGSRLASGSDDQTVRVWNTATGQVQTLKGHSSSVSSVAFSPDGSRLVSGSYDGAVRVWNAATGQVEQTLKGHSSSVSSVAFSPDGSRLASGSRDKTVRVWNTATGQVEQTLEGHSNWVRSAAFSPDSGRLASGSDDRTVRVWNAATGQVEQTLKGHSSSVSSVAFSPDGGRLASGSHDGTVRVWNTATGQVEQMLEGHSDWVRSVAFSPDGSRLASGSDDWTVRVWNAATGQVEQMLKGHSDSVYSIAFSHDGSRLASGSDDRTVRVWNAATGQVEQTLKGHSSWVSSVAFWLDGSKSHSFYSVDRSMAWVTQNGSRILYLPLDYRGEVATEGSTLAIGASTGRVTIITFCSDVKT